MNKLVVGLGEILWDMLPEGKRLGGAPANFAYHVAQAGLDSCVVSAVGKDRAGDEILQMLESKKLTFQISRVPYPTGSVGVELGPRGIPCYQIREQVAWDYIPFTAELEALASRATAVCFGSLAQRHAVSRDTINRFLEAMPEGEGIYKIFDMNLRQNFYTTEILQHSLHKCNILKLNDEELLIVKRLFGYSPLDTQETCRALISDYGLKILILTCGTEGSHIYTSTEESFYPTPRVEVRDTVGAGDSFTAAFCAALLQGDSLSTAHRKAVGTSAYVCTCDGAMPDLKPDLKAASDFAHTERKSKIFY